MMQSITHLRFGVQCHFVLDNMHQSSQELFSPCGERASLHTMDSNLLLLKVGGSAAGWGWHCWCT